MTTVSQVAKSMQTVLIEKADRAGETSGFIKRKRKLKGSSFTQTLVFGWLNKGQASLSELHQVAAAIGVEISESGLSQRFGPEAARMLREVLEAAIEVVIAAESTAIPLLQRFQGVYLQDSSVVGLPQALATIWPGCGSTQGETAALKIQLNLNFTTGALEQLWLQAGREHDQCQAATELDLPVGALRIRDLGYFKLDNLRDEAQRGQFWLSRLKLGTTLYDGQGRELDLSNWLAAQSDNQLDLPIRLGSKHQIPCRLLAERVPLEVAAERRRKLKRAAQKKGQTVSQARLALTEWTLLITNVPSEQLAFEEALVLYGVRWQIELLFKLWKSEGQLAHSRSQHPWRILAEVYAKLTAMIIQHWIFLTGFWAYPDRSLTKAAGTVRQHTLSLAVACNKSLRRLREVIDIINRCLAVGCRLNPRRSRPNTYQLLLKFGELGLT